MRSDGSAQRLAMNPGKSFPGKLLKRAPLPSFSASRFPIANQHGAVWNRFSLDT
jgi:hypothetical protein